MPSNVDESLRTAARTGNVNDLYALFQSNGNVLRRFDRVEFIDTPLHIAAEKGCKEFAMEMMNLKPSFARKLNQQGLSPLHLAIEKGNKEIAIRLVEIDKDLVRVKGKNGETPLHYICKVGNQDGLLDKFLEACPDSIRDVTNQNRTALHVAVESERLDILQILIRTFKKKGFFWEELNRKDEEGNTALHIAARRNQPESIKQTLKLLLTCWAEKYAINQAGLTALDVAKQHDNIESITILDGWFSTRVSVIVQNKLKKPFFEYLNKALFPLLHDVDNISGDDRNALLVVLGLLLTATYQATLSPPGGVWQGENTSKSKGSYDALVLGKSVLNEYDFLVLYIPTYVVFMLAIFLTLGMLRRFPSGFRSAVQVLLAFLALSFHYSITSIAPTRLAEWVIRWFSAIVFIIVVGVMCTVYKLAKISCSFVGCFISPHPLQGFLLFLFLHDQFGKGTILVVSYSSIFATYSFYDGAGLAISLADSAIIIGSWLFLHLCKFCIINGVHKRCTQYCKN